MRRLPLLAILAAVAFTAGLLATSSGDHRAELIAADEPSTTITTMPPQEASSLTLACDSDDEGLVIGCEWDGVPEGADHLVLVRDDQPIWETDDVEEGWHIDDTVEPGVTYVYRISASEDGSVLATSEPEQVRAGGGEPEAPPMTTVPPTTVPPTTVPPTTVPRTQPRPERSQQWYIKMVCGLDDDQVVVCEWAEPPVQVTEWHVVRRLPGTDEVGIPTTSARRIADPTAEPHTTYTYVLNGYDGDQSVVLASAEVTTDGCCDAGLDGQ